MDRYTINLIVFSVAAVVIVSLLLYSRSGTGATPKIAQKGEDSKNLKDPQTGYK